MLPSSTFIPGPPDQSEVVNGNVNQSEVSYYLGQEDQTVRTQAAFDPPYTMFLRFEIT